MLSTTPCELHELTGCSICSGLDYRAGTLDYDELDELDAGPLPRIPGGPTIRANYPGNCAGCGRRYETGAAIHHNKHDGWVLVACCAGI